MDGSVDKQDVLGRQGSHFWWSWGMLLGISGVLVVLATLPPFVGEEVRAILMAGFSNVCHQLSARSPHVEGVALAVCHRCYGIYWGLSLAVLAFLGPYRWDTVFRRYTPYLLGVALVPLSVDWLGDVVGIWTNTPVSRLLTGGVFGVVAGYYFTWALVHTLLPRRTGAAEKVGDERSVSSFDEAPYRVEERHS